MLKLKKLLFVLAVAAITPLVQAAPYAISRTSTMTTSTIPGITATENYKVTFIFNNGGATANTQTWTGAHLTCAIWTFNNAGNVVFKQDLVANLPTTATGSVTTDGAGALTGNFSNIRQNTGISIPNYTVTGVALTDAVRWHANSVNGIFYDTNNARQVSSAGGGVVMAFAGWTSPVQVAGNCDATPAAVATVSVPTLSQWGMVFLVSIMGMFGMAATRRRQD